MDTKYRRPWAVAGVVPKQKTLKGVGRDMIQPSTSNDVQRRFFCISVRIPRTSTSSTANVHCTTPRLTLHLSLSCSQPHITSTATRAPNPRPFGARCASLSAMMWHSKGSDPRLYPPSTNHPTPTSPYLVSHLYCTCFRM